MDNILIKYILYCKLQTIQTFFNNANPRYKIQFFYCCKNLMYRIYTQQILLRNRRIFFPSMCLNESRYEFFLSTIICVENTMNYNSFNVDTLIKHFLCCVPINTIDTLISKETINSLISLEKQQEILQNTINNHLINEYPLKKSYQRSFLKWLMNKIEEGGGEIHDGIYTAYCNLISCISDESIHYRHLLVEGDCISIKESTNMISEGTTGLCSWQGAIDLTQWCIENKNELFGKIILELGCGVGLTGLCIIKKCSPKQYIFTDGHKNVLDMVSQNVKLNLPYNEESVPADLRLKLRLKYNCTDVTIMELRWQDINKYVNEKWAVPDIVIGSDILYDTDSLDTLILGLNTFLSFDNRYAVIAATIRNLDTFSQFLYQLAHHDLSFEECNILQQIVHIQLINLPIKILKIFRKR